MSSNKQVKNSKKKSKDINYTEPEEQTEINLEASEQELDEQEADKQEADEQEADEQEVDEQDADEQEADDQGVDKQEADEQEADEQEADGDNTNIPELEMVSNALKERYEYKPMIRSEIIYLHPSNYITSEVMTKFEYCEIISIRSKQIENGSMPFTDVGNITNPIEIAKKEIEDKKCPLDIIRMLTDKVAEKWSVNDMAIPYD
jgi:DNA-directed RNA polymerase subunit K/omega